MQVWLGGGLPPMNETFQSDFTTRYMDPTEVYAKLGQLAAEFPDISELITLPHTSTASFVRLLGGCERFNGVARGAC